MLTVREDSARTRHPEVVVRRDGRRDQFNVDKIARAVKRCLINGVGMPEAASQPIAQQVARAVSNILAQRAEPASVEDIQRLVIQQLWALDHFEAAEQYTLYREERRKERENYQVDAAMAALIEEDARHFPTPLQYFQFVSKYAKWDDTKKRRETWRECCDRVMTFFKSRPHLAVVDKETWKELDAALYNRQALCAMRILQMAGPALERCNSGAFNCWAHAITDLKCFSETLYLLMNGGGVGFSVESEFVDQLPRIKKQKGNPPRKFTIPDTTEGWCDAIDKGIHAWFDGEDIEFDDSQIRSQGARLKTKGGRSSGKEPLRHLLQFVRTRILARQGGRLTPLDVHDILCMIGKIVQLGGVRRASEISVSDLDDTELRDAKTGNWWEKTPWRDMANNSACYEEKPSAIVFMQEWLALATSGSGERGIFNRYATINHAPRRRKPAKFLINPCGEVNLRPVGQACNVSIVPARCNDTRETLARKVRWATIFGTIQATLTNFKYLRDKWRVTCEEERLLGVDITGQMDCPLLRPGAPGRTELLQYLQQVVLDTNQAWAARLNINPAAAATCVKPGGNSAVFLNCSSGASTRWSPYQIRRARMSRFDPVAKLLAAEGVPHATDPLNDTLIVFDFPVAAPTGCPTRNDLTAIQQLENWLEWKRHWAEHSVSATIYVGPDEWLAVGNWVYEHFDEVCSLSFLPRDSGNYQLAPNEEVTKEQYDELVASFPKINWSKLVRFEQGVDHTISASEIACGNGACEII